jgi:hypothetical protein
MKLILYFADGFAWQYVEQRTFMPEFWDKRRPLRTLLGYSSTIMPAIVTGSPPRETGIWTEYYLDPQDRSATQRFFSRPRTSLLRPLVNLWRLVWFRITRKLGYSAEHRLRLPLDISHLFSRHAIRYDEFPPIALPVPTLADIFTERGLRYEFRYIKGGLRAEEQLSYLRERIDEVDVFFFYDPALDSGGHVTGASAEALGGPIDEIERFLEEAWEVVTAHSEEAEMMLFSDHGMTNVDTTFDLFARLEDFRLGRDYVVFMDSTFARFWFPTEDKRRAVLAALEGVPGRLLTEDDRRRYGIDFADRSTYGEEVLVADEGIVFHPNYFVPGVLKQRRYPERAMHGYLPEAPSTDGIFFYRGNLWTEDPPTPFPVTDIFGAVLSVIDQAPLRTGGRPTGTGARPLDTASRPPGASRRRPGGPGH